MLVKLVHESYSRSKYKMNCLRALRVSTLGNKNNGVMKRSSGYRMHYLYLNNY